MKGKILIVPVIIVIIIALSVWLVYPAYSNGNNGVKEKYNQLRKEQEKLSNAQNKGANIQKLFGKLNSLSGQKDILYKFVPENAKEEEIIDNLNFLA
ncbi:MAG TPA: hypothetical protein ENL05_01010, partial [Candidatus Moranbacteria bacterium]|nr:hypothetical protein [Candidatus Moranbacteria bacterium]